MAENHEVGQGLDDGSSTTKVDPESTESVGEESSGMDELFLSPDDSEGEELDLDEPGDEPAKVPPPEGSAPPAAEPPDEGPDEPDERSAETIRELEERIQELAEERDDIKNRMMRVAADLENFRKRTAREKQEMRKYGIDKVVLELLPVLDNLERALQHSDQSEDKTTIVDGVRMVHRQFIGALKKHGVEGFESVGEMFDPQKHEAIQQVETAEHETGTILEQYQKGYYLHERLIRPALVVVARQIEGETTPQEDADGEQAEPEEPEQDGEPEQQPTGEPEQQVDGETEHADGEPEPVEPEMDATDGDDGEEAEAGDDAEPEDADEHEVSDEEEQTED